MWLATVFGERPSRLAIVALDYAAVSKSRISRSRAVNSGNGSAATRAAAKSAAPLGDRWPEDRLPGRDSPNRAPELFLLGLLDHVSAGPRTHRSEHLFVVVEHVSTSTATSGTAPPFPGGAEPVGPAEPRWGLLGGMTRTRSRPRTS
jgi:hypothetical protein